jgi:hypothetical protein
MFISRLAASLMVSGTLVIPLAMLQPASAATDIGGLNLQRECERIIKSDPRRAVSAHSIQAFAANPKDAYSWRCVAADINDNKPGGDYMRYNYGFDLNKACKVQHPRYSVTAYAKPMNQQDAFSWRCFA